MKEWKELSVEELDVRMTMGPGDAGQVPGTDQGPAAGGGEMDEMDEMPEMPGMPS